MKHSGLLLCAVTLLWSCSQDPVSPDPDQGASLDGRVDLVADAPRPDAPLPDTLAPDTLAPDTLAPDTLAPDMPLPTCTDKKKNGDETDTDCGGATCPKCPKKSACLKAGDCISGVCSGGKCLEATCTDGVKNGDETDTDCGGTVCAKCPKASACVLATDCKSGVCTGGVCQAPSCTDKIKNGDETDTDCGGPTCPKCAAGDACAKAADCATGVCTAGVCAAVSCLDKVKNGSETDVDCGGPLCPKCADAAACLKATDCASGVCTGGKCQAPSCTDTVKNGAETDTDCGGGTCTTCALGKACAKAADCKSGKCTSGKCAQSVFSTACKGILAQDASAANGLYLVSLKGGTPFEVYCDMKGGGWTLAYVSNNKVTGKASLTNLYKGTGLGKLTDDTKMYGVASFGPAFHYKGIELKVTWACGKVLGVASLVKGGFQVLGSGAGSWKDTRTSVVNNNGNWHQNYTGFKHSGSNCHGGAIWPQYVYGFAIGNGAGWGQYVGWYYSPPAGWSTALSNNALDNVAGTVAGWFR